MADIGSFAGGFSQGFSQSFSAGLQGRTLRERLALEREKMDEDQRRFGLQFGLQQEQVGIQHRGMDLQERQFDRQGEQFDQKFDLEGRKQEFLERMQQEQQALDERKFNLQERAADLDFVNAVRTTVLDPNIPKAFRKKAGQQLLPAMGLDPESKDGKEFIDMLLTLDADQAAEFRDMMVGMFPDAQPGQVRAVAGAIAKGQMTIPDAMEMLEGVRQSRMMEGMLGIGGGQQQQAPDPTGGLTDPTPMQEQRPLGEPRGEVTDRQRALGLSMFGGAGGRAAGRFIGDTSPEIQREKAAASATGERQAEMAAPMPNSALDVLGMRGAGLTKGQAEELGIFTDMLDTSAVKEIRASKANSNTAMRAIDELAQMVEGRPEILGSPGALTRGMASLVAQMEGMLVLAGGSLNLSLDEVRQNDVVRNIIDNQFAGASQEVRSRLMDLAYQLVNARKSGRLAVQDIENAFQIAGRSGDPLQFIQTLRSLSDRVRLETIEGIHGMTGFPPLDLLNEQEMDAFIVDLGQSGMSEEQLAPILDSIEKELRKRGL